MSDMKTNMKFLKNYLDITKKIVYNLCVAGDMEHMVDVVQLVRAPDCGSGGRGFESHRPPHFFFHEKVPVLWDIAKW